MIRGGLLHPEILSALASAGHGAQILIADALYPHSTGGNPDVKRVHLNLSPGIVSGPDVVRAIAGTIDIEAATYMSTSEDTISEPVHEFRGILEGLVSRDQAVEWSGLDRHAFYDACLSNNLCLLIATGETRPYANLLLTVGVP